MPDSKKNIEDSCSEPTDASGLTPIEPVIKELTAALHENAHRRDRWMELCAQAAIEQDPRKLLKLVTEINRLFEAREKLPPPKEKTNSDA